MMKSNFKAVVKRIVSVTVIYCILLWSMEIAYADGESDRGDSNINKLLMQLTQEFYPEVIPEIMGITLIYDDDWDICEYAIDISSNGIGYGYVVIESESLDINRFLIDEYADGFYMTQFNEMPDEHENMIVKKIDAINYELVENRDDMVAGKEVTDSLFDIFILDFPDPVYYNYTLKKYKNIGRHCAFGEEFIEQTDEKYCCGVLAMLNVCGAYNIFNKKDINEAKWAYDTLWSMSNVKKIKVIKDKDLEIGDEERYQYVIDQKVMGGVVSQFAKWYGGKEIPYTRKENPSLNFFIEAVDKKYSSILGVTTIEKENGEIGELGHAVSVEGYYVFEPLNSIVYGGTQTYLAVASGWGDDHYEYILYDKVNMESTYGVVFCRNFK